MNSFGRLFRISMLGASHGPGVGVLVDGCPAGLPLAAADLEPDLARRRAGRAGTTRRAEADRPVFRSGLYEGHTTGEPLLIWFDNADTDPAAYADLVHTPRPGHADLTARTKAGDYNDPRGGGAFSGRLTVGLVAAGAVARKLLAGIEIQAALIEAGGSTDVDAAVAAAAAEGDSVGGLVHCQVAGLPAGLGEPWCDSLEGLLAHLIFSIGGVRGIAFGAGFAAARMRGSESNDAILDADGRTATNHAGGINGGLSNGNPLVFQVAVKPTSSIALAQRTVDLRTGQPTQVEVAGRHDACIGLRVPVVVEAACAVVLADLMLLEQRLPRRMPEET